MVAVSQCLSREANFHDIVVEVSHLRPALADLRAEEFGMSAARKDGIGIIVEHDAVFAPKHHDRDGNGKISPRAFFNVCGQHWIGPSELNSQFRLAIRRPASPPHSVSVRSNGTASTTFNPTPGSRLAARCAPNTAQARTAAPGHQVGLLRDEFVVRQSVPALNLLIGWHPFNAPAEFCSLPAFGSQLCAPSMHEAMKCVRADKEM